MEMQYEIAWDLQLSSAYSDFPTKTLEKYRYD